MSLQYRNSFNSHGADGCAGWRAWDLHKVAQTIGWACTKLPLRGRGSEYGAEARASSMCDTSTPVACQRQRRDGRACLCERAFIAQVCALSARTHLYFATRCNCTPEIMHKSARKSRPLSRALSLDRCSLMEGRNELLKSM
jgi:hypothetical protein